MLRFAEPVQVVNRRDVTAAVGAERERALRDGRRLLWRAFWALTALAAAAESTVLATISAVVFCTDLAAAVLHPTDTYRLVAASRFGDLLGWRCGALFLLAAAGLVLWNHERARERRSLAVAARSPSWPCPASPP